MFDKFGFVIEAAQADMLYYAIAFSLLMITLGVFGLVTMKDRAAARIRALSAGTGSVSATARSGGGSNLQITKAQGVRPTGWMKSLVPSNQEQLLETQYQLGSIGFEGVNAVRDFFLVRLALMGAVPMLMGLWVVLAGLDALPQVLSDRLDTISLLGRFQICAVGAAVGFYGPAYWLKSRVSNRRDKIRQGFPNALDLLQISVESGLGFDAALARVGTEIGRVSPEIAYEMLLVQHEIQAGRDRNQAMEDMARRMGIPEAVSFVTVVAQSLQFGTSLTTALRVYAKEMRENRELAAQEKANKLPVHMSAVMSMMMLPALFLITLTPIIIRYMAIF
ncbi:type II secretion system F family protein [Sulfitobacter sabulilitoris]|nr:type II secretion system F family protein [Sulfitobacter sabulilitoris]